MGRVPEEGVTLENVPDGFPVPAKSKVAGNHFDRAAALIRGGVIRQLSARGNGSHREFSVIVIAESRVDHILSERSSARLGGRPRRNARRMNISALLGD
jgi:hypothetical protein